MNTRPTHVNLFITRPNGVKETVVHREFKMINDSIFNQIVAATKAAGRGTVTHYENVREKVKQSDESIAKQKANEFANEVYNEGGEGFTPHR